MTKHLNLEEVCANWFIAREQQEHEEDRGLDVLGVATFKEAGCYKCPGKRDDCIAYFPSPSTQVFKSLYEKYK